VSTLHDLATSALRRLDPETAHRAAVLALKAGLGPRAPREADPILATSLAGLPLPNPVGLAAGFDKNAEVFGAMIAAGFGFVECGTATPLPQAGNPRPRLFRLDEDKAVINRLGFNNGGVEAFARRLEGRTSAGVVGANVGPNRHSADRIGDYLVAIDRLWGLTDYFTINISSPNTAGLRALQSVGALDELLARIAQTRSANGPPTPPLFVKIAPDLDEREIERIVGAANRYGVDGLVISNTTLTRPGALRSPRRTQNGGLSGAPLKDLSTQVLRTARQVDTGRRLALVGVGGIGSGADAHARIRAGASAVQLYSALVFQGPGLIGAILAELASRLRADGFAGVAEAVGTG
jgi:dihydroorotate dehydrogenase